MRAGPNQPICASGYEFRAVDDGSNDDGGNKDDGGDEDGGDDDTGCDRKELLSELIKSSAEVFHIGATVHPML